MITNVFVKQVNMKTLYYILFRKLLDNTDYIAKAMAYIFACLPDLFLNNVFLVGRNLWSIKSKQYRNSCNSLLGAMALRVYKNDQKYSKYPLLVV
jgi:hypothetical protein